MPFMNEADSLKRWWQQRRWWALVVTLLVFGVVALPGYRLLKEWRAGTLARQALELADEESTYYSAWEKANSAYYLAPGKAEVVRILAKVYAKDDPGQALPHWERALELSGGEPQDRIGLALSALELGDLERAGEQVDALQAAGVRTEESARLQAAYHFRLREFQSAVEVLVPWVRDPGAAEATHSLYLQISVASGDAELRAEGLNHIMTLAQRDTELGLRALRLLIPLQEKDEDLIALLDNRLEEHPLTERADLLKWITWKGRTDRIDRVDAYQEVLTLFNLEADEDRVELGRWLNQNGYSDRVTALFSIDAARRRQDLFLVYMDALAIQGRWEEIRRILESGSVPLESYLQQVFLARSYYETGLDRRARLGWQRVRLEIANDPEKLAFFANYARRLSLYEEAREAYRRMTEIPASMRRGHVELISMERQQGDSTKLWEALQTMHQAYPDDVAVANDMRYLQLLLEKEVPAGVEAAKKLVAQNPAFLAHRITLALGHLRMDQPEAAISVFNELEIPLNQLSASFRTVLGAVLRRNGQDPQADASFRGVDVRNLLKEEQELFQTYAVRSSQ